MIASRTGFVDITNNHRETAEGVMTLIRTIPFTFFHEWNKNEQIFSEILGGQNSHTSVVDFILTPDVVDRDRHMAGGLVGQRGSGAGFVQRDPDVSGGTF